MIKNSLHYFCNFQKLNPENTEYIGLIDFIEKQEILKNDYFNQILWNLFKIKVCTHFIIMSNEDWQLVCLPFNHLFDI